MHSRLRLLGSPLCDSGAPSPFVVADEHALAFGYTTNHNLCASAVVKHCLAFKFGHPNDEALHGHRYASMGLKPYGAFEVERSEWIGDIVEANRAHGSHLDELFSKYRHFIFCFHDSTLEFISEEEPEFVVVAGEVTAMVIRAFTNAR